MASRRDRFVPPRSTALARPARPRPFGGPAMAPGQMPEAIRRDSRGFEDLDAYFGGDRATVKLPTASASTGHGASSAAVPRPRRARYSEVSSGDDTSFAADDSRLDESEASPPRRKPQRGGRRAASKGGRRGGSRKAAPSRRGGSRRRRSEDEDEDEESSFDDDSELQESSAIDTSPELRGRRGKGGQRGKKSQHGRRARFSTGSERSNTSMDEDDTLDVSGVELPASHRVRFPGVRQQSRRNDTRRRRHDRDEESGGEEEEEVEEDRSPPARSRRPSSKPQMHDMAVGGTPPAAAPLKTITPSMRRGKADAGTQMTPKEQLAAASTSAPPTDPVGGSSKRQARSAGRSSASSAAAAARVSPGRSSGRKPARGSPKAAASPMQVDDEEGQVGLGGDGFDDEGGFDDMAGFGEAMDEGDDEEEDVDIAAPSPAKRTPAPAKKGRGGKAKRTPVAPASDDDDDDDGPEVPVKKAKSSAARKKGAARKPSAGSKRRRPPARVEDDEDDEDEDSSMDEAEIPLGPKTPGGRHRMRKSLGVGVAPGGGSAIRHISALEQEQVDDGQLRRSRRRRYEPLKFWEGQHVQQRGDTVIAVEEGVGADALARTERERQKAARKAARKKARRAKAEAGGGSGAEVKEVVKVVKPKTGVHYPPALRRPPTWHTPAESSMVKLPGEGGQPPLVMSVLRSHADLEFSDLPTSDEADARPKGFEEGAKAAAAFDTPSFISGTLRLTPKACKDTETTDQCPQVFTVISSQPKALHLTVDDKQFLLSPGDHFFVPAATPYRVINLSTHTPAEISFVVIKPSVDDESDEE